MSSPSVIPSVGQSTGPNTSVNSSVNTNPAPAFALSDSMRQRFAFEVAKYPADQRQSAVMACLAIVQQVHGHVPATAEVAVAAYLGMAPIAVREVTTFYNMYNQQPVGRFKLNVCTNLPCQLRDGEQALQHLCQRLGIEPGGTSADGLFTVQQSECLGACADAPVLLVNDRQMVSLMSNERLDDLVATLRQQADHLAAQPPAAK